MKDQIEKMVGAQKPICWAESDGEGGILWDQESCFSDDPAWFNNPMPLYAAPPAQQPQEIEVQCPVCNHKFHEWPNDKQPQAETDNHEAQGQIEFLDKKNNALSAAIRKIMARLADLLDEDQFKEIEEIVSFAGVQQKDTK